MSVRKSKAVRVVGRSREFQDYLDRLSGPELAQIEAGEAAYLAKLNDRLFQAEHVYGEQMLGAEDVPAGTRIHALAGYDLLTP